VGKINIQTRYINGSGFTKKHKERLLPVQAELWPRAPNATFPTTYFLSLFVFLALTDMAQ
jgi:hypothetical protein